MLPLHGHGLPNAAVFGSLHRRPRPTVCVLLLYHGHLHRCAGKRLWPAAGHRHASAGAFRAPELLWQPATLGRGVLGHRSPGAGLAFGLGTQEPDPLVRGQCAEWLLGRGLFQQAAPLGVDGRRRLRLRHPAPGCGRRGERGDRRGARGRGAATSLGLGGDAHRVRKAGDGGLAVVRCHHGARNATCLPVLVSVYGAALSLHRRGYGPECHGHRLVRSADFRLQRVDCSQAGADKADCNRHDWFYCAGVWLYHSAQCWLDHGA
mmetsp:Transcript_122557/g.291327  ORF Transcript_122557/g.291327 Transcript_122557/m.291327 type:complete len:263 (+) Transcript_122557:293-1081(+)